MKIQNTNDEQIYFDHYDPEALHKIIDTQHKVIDYMENKIQIIKTIFHFSGCLGFC